jgi:hypothetical protein
MKILTDAKGTRSDGRLEKLQDVLLAARNTEYYSPRLAAAHLSTAAEVAGLRGIEEGLARLPCVDLSALVQRRESFRNRALPAPATLENERPEVAPNDWRRTLGFRVRSVAGRFGALQRLAAEVRSGQVSLSRTVRRATVHSRVDLGLLRDAERDALWRDFEFPIFEEVRGFDDELLAWECEAHSGLHVNAACAVTETAGNGGGELVLTSLAGLRYPMLRVLTGLIVRQAEGLCECGEESARVIFPPSLRKPAAVEHASFGFGSQGVLAG